MKEYIKPEVELLKYSFSNTIAADSNTDIIPENPIPDNFGDSEDMGDWGEE